MGILDQFFVYHPEPWQDRDWARLSGLPLEDVWLLAAGWRNHRAFEEVNIRAAYHDLLDPEPGFTPDAQIESCRWHCATTMTNRRFALRGLPRSISSHWPRWMPAGTLLESERGHADDPAQRLRTLLAQREWAMWASALPPKARYSSAKSILHLQRRKRTIAGAYEGRHRVGGGGQSGCWWTWIPAETVRFLFAICALG